MFKRYNNLIMFSIIIVPLIMFPLNHDYFMFPKLLILLFVMTILIAKLITNKEPLFIKNESTKYLFAYLFFLVFSTLFSEDFFLSLWGGYGREEGIIALILYVLFFLYAQKYFKLEINQLTLITITASVVSVIAVFQFYNIRLINLFYQSFFSLSLVTGTIGNQNFLATYLVLMLPLAMWGYLKFDKKIMLLPTALIYLTLLMTMTRGAWLGAFISYLAMYFIAIRANMDFKRLSTVFVMLLSISIFFDYTNNGVLLGRFLSISQDAMAAFTNKPENFASGSGFQRIFIWEHVIELIKERPLFGWGPDTLGYVFPRIYRQQIFEATGSYLLFDKAHNEYLQIAYASGIPALLIYLAYILTILKTAWKNLFINPLMVPLFCSVLGYCVQAFFNISVVSVAYIFWIFLGEIMFMARQDQATSGVITNLDNNNLFYTFKEQMRNN